MHLTSLQSTLDPAPGSAAATIAGLSDVLHIGGALILGLICFLAIVAVFGRPGAIRARRWLVGGGLAFPVATLAALFVYAFAIGNSLGVHGEDDALRVHIIGKQWWWEVRYEQDDKPSVVLANEVRIPVGQPVHVRVSSGDVIHSFWIPALAGKVDMVPGHTNHLVLRTDAAGVYRGQCAEYCGAQHALMALFVIAEPSARFSAWLEHQSRPALMPADAQLRLGHDLFFRGGCATCHTIRGTRANGQLGPDLTHVGSRESLAAGTLRNHVGTMGGWIAGAQDLKPASLMPDAVDYSGSELRAISAWLVSLK